MGSLLWSIVALRLGTQVGTLLLYLHVDLIPQRSDPVAKGGSLILSSSLGGFSPKFHCFWTCRQAEDPGEIAYHSKPTCLMTAKKHERKGTGSCYALQWLALGGLISLP